jgi:hypothetical protein
MVNSNINSGIIISYLTMRRMIGILGIGLPLIVVLGGFIQNGYILDGSISSYYYTNMRDVFVGLLCCMGLFLISYKGYHRIDHNTGNIGGILALGTAFFPTSNDNGKIIKVGIFQLNDILSGYIHLTFATLFLITLAFMSIFLFTRSGSNLLTKEKKKRNSVYVICGYVILFSILCMVFYEAAFQNTFIAKLRPILIFETLSLVSFGISWLVKGETFLKDKEIE